jgi:restriction system protein
MFGPVLRAVRDLGGSARPQEVYERVADELKIDAEKRSELTSTGVPRLYNQMAWARFYLVRGGLLDSSSRGVWALTVAGQARADLTNAGALEVMHGVRRQMAEESKSADPKASDPVEGDGEAPVSDHSTTAPASYRSRVIEILQAVTPSGFERFCQRLLREAGFQNVVITGRAGDGGIDGIGILEVNALVSFKVLFQCKRYRKSVGSEEVRNFRGAMMGRADKGIILTTGGFTADARKESVRDGVPPIELVDSEKLVTMLEQLEIGLLPVTSYRVDEPFFESFAKVLGDSEGTVNLK